MIPGPAVEGNELSDALRVPEAAINIKITRGITGVPTIEDGSP